MATAEPIRLLERRVASTSSRGG